MPPFGFISPSEAGRAGKSVTIPPMNSGLAPFMLILLGNTVEVSETPAPLKAERLIHSEWTSG